MSITLKPYPEYRDSGLPWLGQIPGRWQERRLKLLFSEIDDRSDSGQETLLSMRQQRGLVPHNDVSDKEINSGELVGYKRTQVNDVVMNRMRASSGLFARTPMYGLVSPDYAVLRKRIEINVEYYVHLFKSPLMQAEFRAESKGLGTGSAGFLRLYSDRFGAISVPLPPREEQDTIVTFIQTADELVDRLILAKQQLIELLNEQKQAIIHRGVTCGLDPYAPTRPVGSDWLTKVPRHWEIRRLRSCFSSVMSGLWGDDPLPGQVDDHIVCVRVADFDMKSLSVSDARLTIRSVPAQKRHSRLLQAKDILIEKSGGGDSEPIGRVVMFDLNCEAICSNFVSRIRPKKDIVRSEFLLYVLSFLQSSRRNVPSIKQTTGIQNLNERSYFAQPFPVPPLSEQDKIIDYIESQLQEIRKAQVRVYREIDLIREYRTRLVSDVATGKLDVRGVELPEPSTSDGATRVRLNGLESVVAEGSPDTEEVHSADL